MKTSVTPSLVRKSLIVVVATVGLSGAGCSPKKSSESGGSTGQSEADVQSAELSDAAADQAIEAAAASVRRDGQGQIIEVNFREKQLGDVVGKLSSLPKLRSLLLAESDVSDAMLGGIGEITTLENLDLRGCAISDLGLARLEGLSRLKSIKLSGKGDKTKVTAVGAKTLAKLASLKVIALDFLPIGDAGVKSLSELSDLKELYLAGSSLTDAAADSIKRFKGLAKLRLASNDLSSQAVVVLSDLSDLEEFDVSDCAKVDDDAIKPLAKLGKLSKLNLYATEVAEGPWAELSGLQHLRWLNVDKTGVNDAALEGIGTLEGLKFLHLGSTKITDAGMPKLAGLQSLENLIVTRTAVTQAGVDQLQQLLPGTEIQLEYVEGK
ncbi:leucine-rich repeat domain-containing protein [Rhodopirellula sp. MGV]|uniref:leucine-rich repeat domain-containing protein n=1 Tax=Rhodopirellula sp. MGV TaxID=2023130 RepID=UPI000B971371|nr:hypothetical protein [Rhodopirellula sp. MGV]OYP38129.1 hypothetical protein CGZ80_02520 [Rhodopirellula sp. MGV]PNY38467.1 hypothetical protein C2E31_00575 [Rhodopirellula baltica]